MENTSDSFMPGSLLFCMKSKKSVCYSVADNNNITALVSLNNFGKSNVLSAIDFGLTYIKSNIEDKIDMMGRDKSIISLSKEIKKRHFIKVQKQEDVHPKLKWKMQSLL